MIVNSSRKEKTNSASTAESKKRIFLERVKYFCDTTTSHGFGWYSRFDSVAWKSAAFIIPWIGLFMLLGAFAIELVEWSYSTEMLTTSTKIRKPSLVYPTITLCHPDYFNMKEAKALGINNSVANYMTTMFDMGFPEYLQSELESDPGLEILSEIKSYDTFLDQLLKDKNFTMAEVFRKMAIECKDFMFFCDVHNKISQPQPHEGRTNCCESYFDTEPTFTPNGVCYTTNKVVTEKHPYEFSAMEIWANLQYRDMEYMDLELRFKSGKALKEGLYYAILPSKQSVFEIENVRQSVEYNKIQTVSLQFHQEKRLTKDCYHGNEDMSDWWTLDMSYSEAACHFMYTNRLANCSLAEFFGIKQKTPNEQPQCTPEMTRSTLERVGDELADFAEEKCKMLCERNYTTFSTTTASLNIEKLIEQTQNSQLENVTFNRKISAIRVYFSSLQVNQLVLYQEGWDDILSKLGGWAGLIMGVSIISILESWMFMITTVWKVIVSK